MVSKNNINVLHVFGRLDSGGAESRTMDIYRNINKRIVNFGFIIHTLDECFYSREVKTLGGTVSSVPRFKIYNVIQYYKAWNKFFKNNKDIAIIHGHLTTTAFIYFRLAKKHGIKVRIAHARNSKKESLIKTILSKFSRFYATHFLAVSKLASISEFGKRITEKQVKIFPNAINVNEYIFNKKWRQTTRESLGFNESANVYIHIGRFHKQKNHLYLIEVFEKINKKNNNSKLILVGKGDKQDLVKKEVFKRNLQTSVLFLGVRDDIPNLLSAADCLLFPSLYEGLPGVVLEAQAAGLPCLISNKITQEVKITELVSFLSIDDSKEQWVDLAMKSVDSFERKNTKQDFIKAKFDIQAVAKLYENYYQTVFMGGEYDV